MRRASLFRFGVGFRKTHPAGTLEPVVYGQADKTIQRVIVGIQAEDHIP